VDDKEPKNIDGIINTDTSSETQPTTINVTEAPAEEQSNDSVSVSDEGEVQIVDAPEEVMEATETESSANEMPAQKEDHSNENINTSTEKPLEPPVSDVNQDTTDVGIVPSVQPTAITTPDEVTKLKKRNKSLKIVLVVIIILLVAITSALVVYFSQQQKAASDLDQKNQQISELQNQIAEQQKTSTQATIDSLNTQLEAEKKKNAELSAEITKLNATISSYQVAAEKLLTLCGSKCNSVELPETEQPASTNTSSNSNQ